MSRIAVVGAGISGLTAAWLLSRRHDVLLFERAARLGGHTHTHCIETPEGPRALDTGMLVYNERTYPLLSRLLGETGVAARDADVSFGVYCPQTGFEYSTRGVHGLFADSRNLVRPGHYRLLADIVRFNRTVRRAAARPEIAGEDDTFAEFLDRQGFGGELLGRYLLPFASTVWSVPPSAIGRAPARAMLRRLRQHDMDALFDRPAWKVIDGGSAAYIPKLLQSPRIAVHLSAAPVTVSRGPDAVTLTFADRPAVVADQVVFACHGDEVPPMLSDATSDERVVLGAFQTSPTDVVLHTDAPWLPRRPAARAAWNCLIDDGAALPTVTCDLNRLQRIRAPRSYYVTLNPRPPAVPAQVLVQTRYTHPLPTREAVAAQQQWTLVSGRRRTHYCGAYWFDGLHEDGVRSAVRVAAALGTAW